MGYEEGYPKDNESKIFHLKQAKGCPYVQTTRLMT